MNTKPTDYNKHASREACGDAQAAHQDQDKHLEPVMSRSAMQIESDPSENVMHIMQRISDVTESAMQTVMEEQIKATMQQLVPRFTELIESERTEHRQQMQAAQRRIEAAQRKIEATEQEIAVLADTNSVMRSKLEEMDSTINAQQAELDTLKKKKKQASSADESAKQYKENDKDDDKENDKEDDKGSDTSSLEIMDPPEERKTIVDLISDCEAE